jgi:hypothetical protein
MTTATAWLTPAGEERLTTVATECGWNAPQATALIAMMNLRRFPLGDIRAALRYHFTAYQPSAILDWLGVLHARDITRLAACAGPNYAVTGMPGTATEDDWPRLIADIDMPDHHGASKAHKIVRAWTHLLGEDLAPLGHGSGIGPIEAMHLRDTHRLDDTTLRTLCVLRGHPVQP